MSKQTLLLRGLKSIFDRLFLLKLAQVVLINFTKKEVFEMVFDIEKGIKGKMKFILTYLGETCLE